MSKTVTLRFRCTPEQADEIRRRSQGNMSAFILSQALGTEFKTPSPSEKPAEDTEALIKRLSLRMPKANAERLARRQTA